jgi:hypothetical protein
MGLLCLGSDPAQAISLDSTSAIAETKMLLGL